MISKEGLQDGPISPELTPAAQHFSDAVALRLEETTDYLKALRKDIASGDLPLTDYDEDIYQGIISKQDLLQALIAMVEEGHSLSEIDSYLHEESVDTKASLRDYTLSLKGSGLDEHDQYGSPANTSSLTRAEVRVAKDKLHLLEELRELLDFEEEPEQEYITRDVPAAVFVSQTDNQSLIDQIMRTGGTDGRTVRISQPVDSSGTVLAGSAPVYELVERQGYFED